MNYFNFRNTLDKLAQKLKTNQELPSVLKSSERSNIHSELEELNLKKESDRSSKKDSQKLEFYIHKTHQNDEVISKQVEHDTHATAMQGFSDKNKTYDRVQYENLNKPDDYKVTVTNQNNIRIQENEPNAHIVSQII